MTDVARSSVSVAAPPAVVMKVIADLGAYPQWVRFIKQVEIVDVDSSGRASLARFTLDAGAIADDYTLAYSWSDDEVSWHLVRGTSIKAMDGSYRLRRTESGCDVEYALSIEVGVPLLAAFKRRAELVIIETALRDLKARVEA